MIQLRERLHTPEVRELLAHAVGGPSPTKLQQVIERYASDDALVLLGIEADGGLVGCIGLDVTSRPTATIVHIAVEPNARAKGIGRHMVDAVLTHYSLTRLVAETDASAVGFYRACGFSITSLGEKYPGVERFLCEWPTK